MNRQRAAGKIAAMILDGADAAVRKVAGVMLCGADCEPLLRDRWSELTQLFAFAGCAMFLKKTLPLLLPDYLGFLNAVYERVLMQLAERADARFQRRDERDRVAGRESPASKGELLDELTAFLVYYRDFRHVVGDERYAGTYGYETGRRAAQIVDRPDDIGIIGVAASMTYSILRIDDVNAVMRTVYALPEAPALAASGD